jgi:predicted transport protein
MALSVTGEEVELVLRKLLPQQKFKLLNIPRKIGETGADIIVQKDNTQVFIECIGFQEVPPIRSKQFYEVFFRAISRLNNGNGKCVIALPIRFKNGMDQRAKHYGEAWKRIGYAFPELEIWFVDTKKNAYEEYKWNDWPTVLSNNMTFADNNVSYTEDSHLKNNKEVINIYKRIQKTFRKIKSPIKFKPVKTYIGVYDTKNIAYIRIGKNKIKLLVLLSEDKIRKNLISQHHKIIRHQDSYWHLNRPNCDIEITDLVNFEEIERLLQKVVENNEES